MKFTQLVQTACLALIIVTLVACGGAEDRKAKHLAKAQEYLAANNLSKAQVEAKNALQIFPKDIQVRLLLADIADKSRNFKGALGQYQKVLSIDANSTIAKAKIAQYYLIAYPLQKSEKLLKSAKKLITEVLAVEKDNALALAVQARISAFEGKFDEATKSIEASLAIDAQSTFATETKIILMLRQKKLAEVESYILATIKTQPKNSLLPRMLVKIYLKQKKTKEAIAVLLAEIKKNPKNRAVSIDLIRLYVATKQKEKAAKIYGQLVEADASNDSLKEGYVYFLDRSFGKARALQQINDYIALNKSDYTYLVQKATLLVKYKQLDDAIVLYKRVIAEQVDKPISIKAKSQYAAILLVQGNLKEAQKLISDVLAKKPKESRALIVNAQLAIRKGDYQTAIINYQTVLSSSPNLPKVMRYLAAAYSLNKNDDLAKEMLAKLIRIRRNDVKSVVMLASLYIKDKQFELAKKQFEGILSRAPKHFAALRSLFEIQIRGQELKEAERTANKLIAYYPKTGVGEYYLGLVYQKDAKAEKAIQQFEISHNKDPKSYRPVAALAAMYVKADKVDLAIKRVSKVIEQNPDNMSAITLLGKLYIKNKDHAKAEQTLKNVIKAKPKLSAPYYNLASYYVAFKKTDLAVSVLNTGIKLVTKSQGLQFMLATIHQRTNNVEAAIKIYEAMYKEQPKNLAVINNLALLLAEKQPSIARALKIVSQLESTKNPYLLDTVGWVKFKAGKVDVAIVILKEVASKLPKVGEVQYHLGMAYFKKNNLAEAKKYLQYAINSKQNFSGIEEAKTTLAKL